MIDSEASYSVISEDQANFFGAKIHRFSSVQPSLRRGAGHNIVPIGFTSVLLWFGTHQFLVLFRVFADLSYDVILGNRALYQRKAVVKYDELSLSMEDDEGVRTVIPISTGEIYGVTLPRDLMIVTAQKVVIPPNSETYLPAKVVSPSKGSLEKLDKAVAAIIEGTPKVMNDGLVVARSIGVLKESEGLGVAIVKFTNEAVQLNKGRKLGDVSLLSETCCALNDTIADKFGDGPGTGSEESSISPVLTEEQRDQTRELLRKKKVLFSFSVPGRTSLMKHRIHTSGICHARQYRLAEKEVDKIQTICDELEQQDIIKKSCSPYNSPCNKSDGSSRFCLDLRSLNGYLAPASYPTDSIKDSFDYLGDNNWWFTSLDVKSAFWSIKVHDLDTEKLVFTVRQNKNEFVWMLFGLTTSPFSWALLINMVLSDTKFSHVLSYVDDLLVYS
ncbi:unnamed protein product, partial [Heterosigma akashiwo]